MPLYLGLNVSGNVAPVKGKPGSVTISAFNTGPTPRTAVPWSVLESPASGGAPIVGMSGVIADLPVGKLIQFSATWTPQNSGILILDPTIDGVNITQNDAAIVNVKAAPGGFLTRVATPASQSTTTPIAFATVGKPQNIDISYQNIGDAPVTGVAYLNARFGYEVLFNPTIPSNRWLGVQLFPAPPVLVTKPFTIAPGTIGTISFTYTAPVPGGVGITSGLVSSNSTEPAHGDSAAEGVVDAK